MKNPQQPPYQWKTREVLVGNIKVGGGNPIRIQSMTTSDTRDVQATVEQIMRLSDAGCEIARVTVQGMREADACELIKNALLKKGYLIPLVADIHFYPPAALRVADFADKVRINPGNFVDKRASFKIMEYDDQTYASELEKIAEKFTPLVEKCKRLKRAIRIGTNHGSLSDRIMNRYGDTAAGMVESALEFGRVARLLDFHDLIFSMKASHTQVMILAYRLLVEAMLQLGWDYPLHLGVTEAGEGEDGRIKSAIGIGSLLLDGIGDTIRVSLTEDPWCEIAPCKKLATLVRPYQTPPKKREKKRLPLASFLHRNGSVVLRIREEELDSPTFFQDIGCEMQEGRLVKMQDSVDALVIETKNEKLQLLERAGIAILEKEALVTEDEAGWERLKRAAPAYILFSPTGDYVTHTRRFCAWMGENKLAIPLILDFSYQGSLEDFLIPAAAEYGSLLCDGFGEGISLNADIALKERRMVAFSILQGARLRSFKTEFISCPGCGRTLFDLQKVAKGIREQTAHLPGVKIAIMGCIVNGPGEMADADFGYVGSKPGKIDLYIGKNCVERDIEMSEAVDRLVSLIKKEGRWVEPSLK